MTTIQKPLRRANSLRVVVANTITTSPGAHRGAYILESKGKGPTAGNSCIEIGNKENHAPGALALRPRSANSLRRKRHRRSSENELCERNTGVEMEVFLDSDSDFTTFLSESPDALSTSTTFSNVSSTVSTPPDDIVVNPLEKPQHIPNSSPAAQELPIFFDLRPSGSSEDALVVPLTLFEVSRRLRTITKDTNAARDFPSEAVMAPRPPCQAIPITATSSRFCLEIDGERNYPESSPVIPRPVHVSKIIRRKPGVLMEPGEKIHGGRTLQELGFDMSCLSSEGDDVLSCPWTTFENELRGGTTSIRV